MVSRREIDNAVQALNKGRLFFQNGCFVAGTPVHTKDGLKPIEQIKVGDYVLSKHESGKAYKRVVNTFVHDDKLVRKIAYGTTDGSNETNRLYVTNNHPFWVVGIGWTRADLVECGQELEMADGSRVMVYTNVPVFRTPQPGVGWSACFNDSDLGTEFDFINQKVLQVQVSVDGEIEYSEDPFFKVRVYNFEVEDFHTYYVGGLGSGVWVLDTSCK